MGVNCQVRNYFFPGGWRKNTISTKCLSFLSFSIMFGKIVVCQAFLTITINNLIKSHSDLQYHCNARSTLRYHVSY